MRMMDGLMAIPAILLAIALVALLRREPRTVIVAIAIPEIPRVVRLVRTVVLTVREEPYVEAAHRHRHPTAADPARAHPAEHHRAADRAAAPIICAAAILIEAILGFLGVGIPPEIPTWGNIMAEGRTFFQRLPA